MLKIIKLFIPALIPSWNFFDVIAPSPRIEYTLLSSIQTTPSQWHAFRPRPAHVSLIIMLKRMLWNPWWNETLFMMSCAERLMEAPTRHSEQQILQRIISDIQQPSVNIDLANTTYVQFRLLTVARHGDTLQESIVYHSGIHSLPQKSSA